MKFFLFIYYSIVSSVLLAEELPIILDSRKSDPFLPVTYYFNSAFDVIQNPYWFSQTNFFRKHKKLFKRIGSPHHSIKKDGGYQKLFEDEFLTTRVVPNIGLHMIGGAYDNLYLHQYFKENGNPYPMISTVVLSYLGHFGNEALELTNENITSHDHIADLFVFDVLSYVIATNPKLMNFLVHDMQMNAWHLQPMYLPQEGDITNAGLNYTFRPDLFRSKLKPFLFIGMQNLLGLSYALAEKEYITASVGMALTDPLEQKGRFVTALFYDRADGLYSSLYINGTEDYRIRLNLYPEAFSFKKLKLGLLLGQKKSREKVIGVNLNLPIGVAYFN